MHAPYHLFGKTVVLEVKLILATVLYFSSSKVNKMKIQTSVSDTSSIQKRHFRHSHLSVFVWWRRDCPIFLSPTLRGRCPCAPHPVSRLRRRFETSRPRMITVTERLPVAVHYLDASLQYWMFQQAIHWWNNFLFLNSRHLQSFLIQSMISPPYVWWWDCQYCIEGALDFVFIWISLLPGSNTYWSQSYFFYQALLGNGPLCIKP